MNLRVFYLYKTVGFGWLRYNFLNLELESFAAAHKKSFNIT